MDDYGNITKIMIKSAENRIIHWSEIMKLLN